MKQTIVVRQKLADLTIRADISDYIKPFVKYMKARNFSERTVKTYEGYAGFFRDFLAQQYIRDIHEVTPEMLTDYQISLCSKNELNNKLLSVKTQSLRLVAVIMFFRFLYEHKYLSEDMAVHIRLPRIPKTLPRLVLSRKEMLSVLREPNGADWLEIRDKAILELFYSSGIRNTEMRKLRVFDVDFCNGLIKVTGKGGKERIIPMGDVAAKYIQIYLSESRPHLAKKQIDILFLTKNGNMLTDDFPAEMARKYAHRAGLKKDIDAHCLRHTFATHMLKRNASLRVIQEMLGHESLQTTQIYTRVEISDLKKVHSKTHPRGKDLM